MFISYSKRDAVRARALAEVLVEAGFEPWMAELELGPGENWAKAIGQAIEKAESIVFVISKDFFASASLSEEWNFALGSKKHAGRVLPVLMAGTRAESLPWIAKRIQHVKAGPDWGKTARSIVSALRERKVAG